MKLSKLETVLCITGIVSFAVSIASHVFKKPDGELQIDTSDEKDIYRFVVNDSNLYNMSKKKYVRLKIVHTNLREDYMA